jgi:hypothetical protein
LRGGEFVVGLKRGGILHTRRRPDRGTALTSVIKVINRPVDDGFFSVRKKGQRVKKKSVDIEEKFWI